MSRSPASRSRWSSTPTGNCSSALLILADDFTGACDAAGAFGAARSTLVSVGAPETWPPGTEVLAVDLDVRDKPADAARAAIEAAARRLGAEKRVFVKIDSTLRGPIAALVEGALEGTRKPLAMVGPAFPEQGRFLRDGYLYMGDVRGAKLDAMPNAVIVDADSPEPLRRLADEAQNHPEWLLVGSAGLARHLAGPSSVATIDQVEGLILVVVGSPAQATHQQLQRLDGHTGVVVVSTTPSDKRDEGQVANTLADTVSEWAASHAKPGAVVLTGGATARAVCHRLSISAIRVKGELSPGIPIGSIEEGIWHGVTVVTKAGGFGGPDTLLDVARAFGVPSQTDD